MSQLADPSIARVKVELSSQQASHGTVLLVHSLLGLYARGSPASNGGLTTDRNITKASAIRTSRKAASTATRQPDAGSSGSEALSVIQKRKFATELVSLGSKALTAATQCQSSSSNNSRDPEARQALQPRSGNSTSSPRKRNNAVRAKAAPRDSTTESFVCSAAQCAHTALAYLRGFATDGTRQRLLEGSLSFCKHLLTHGLDQLVLIELEACRRLLNRAEVALDGTTCKTNVVECMLRLDDQHASDPELARLAVIQQTLAMKAIAMQRRGKVVDDLASYLATATRPPHAVISTYMQLTKQNDKSAVYLETIATALSSLCPKLSASSDADGATSPSCGEPLSNFRIQVYALHLRRTWWILANHQVDAQKSLSNHFTRALKTYVGKARAQEPHAVFAAAVAGYKLIFEDVHSPIAAGYEVLHILNTLAINGGSIKDAVAWAERLNQCCSTMMDTDCRKLAAKTSQLCQQIDLDVIDTLATHLAGKLQGQPEQYETLLHQLSRLLLLLSSQATTTATPSYSRLVRNTLRILCWAASTYPDLVSASQRSIIYSCLRSCSRSDLASWLDQRAILCYIRGGVMTTIAEAAKDKSLKDTFTSSAEVMAFGELLDVLILRQLKNIKSQAEQLDPLEIVQIGSFDRAVLLDWRLRACLKYGSSSSVQTMAATVYTGLLSELDKLYDPEKHPVRRALVAVQVALAVGKGLVSDKEVMPWQHILVSEHKLAHDADLHRYVPDITACLQVTLFIEQSDRTIAQLQPALQAWHSLLNNPANADCIDQVIYDKTTLAALLDTLASLCAALGWQRECLQAHQIRSTLLELSRSSPVHIIDGLLAVSESSSAVGLPSLATRAAEQAMTRTGDAAHPLGRIRCMIAVARAYHGQQRMTESREAVRGIKIALDATHAQSSSDRRELAMLCAKAWWLHSELCLFEGDLLQAMTAARTSVSIINSIWTQIEQKGTKKVSSANDDTQAVDLTSKIRKLNLTSAKAFDEAPPVSNRGSSFWAIVPTAAAIIMHAADVYLHAGLFVEANHHAARAVVIADPVSGSMLSIAARSKLASILVLAGKVEDAELCLARLDHVDLGAPHMAIVDLWRARAKICARNDEFEEALKHFDAACDVLAKLDANLDGIGEAGWTICPDPDVIAPRTKASGARSRSAVKANAAGKTRIDKLGTVHERKLGDIKLERAHTEHKLGHQPKTLQPSDPDSSSLRQLRHLETMSRFEVKAQTDVVFNALIESSLICPGINELSVGPPATKINSQRPPAAKTKVKPSATRAKTSKTTTATIAPTSELAVLLHDARGSLKQPIVCRGNVDTTIDVHRECQMLVTSSMYSAATNLGAAKPRGVLEMATTISTPAALATLREKYALEVDASSTHKSAQLAWPCAASLRHDVQEQLNVEIGEILPDSWTVVSLHLNVDATELLIMRQHKDESCFIVRLPFARQDIEAERQESFDFAAGKAELVEIIERSNSICHAGNEPTKKMASATWWRERELLDKRLHELLTNIEEIWLGGFKGILCPNQCHEGLSDFRKQFQTILARYIPSTKDERELSLPDTTLKLFLNLCYGQGSSLDIDEPVLDLLYSVVDSLRFNGRELAFDEIDFDALTIELSDALQRHHDSTDKEPEVDQHLILVLDKRLQNFPWESLPYLENASISRMGDIMSLKERILSMRQTDGQHHVSGNSGTVILDPAADMKRTQETMQPALESLMTARPAWQSIKGRSPSEAEFETALSSSDVLMYFGHGAGSQYIRPRTVKKLARCSEVVWLMGCSSGAVTEHGDLEATSVPASYLMAGASSNMESQGRKCFAVLANLWDVTDKDIDRFSIAVGSNWGLWSLTEDAAQSKPAIASSRTGRHGSSDAPMVPVTPKASRPPRADLSSKTPARQRDKGPSRARSLSEAVSRSRDACYLRYLNGAAPVVYGLPVYLDKR